MSGIQTRLHHLVGSNHRGLDARRLIRTKVYGRQSNEKSLFCSRLLFLEHALLIFVCPARTYSAIKAGSLEDMPGMSMIWLSS